MSVPRAFLALLSERPMNGNQLKSEFEVRTGATWPLNVGQAYTTLQRLQRDELIEATDDGADDSELYRVTDTGAQAVSAWWASPVERTRPARDELAIKLTLAATSPGVDVRAVVRIQRTESMRMLHEYTRLKAEGGDGADLSWRLLLESLIFQTEAEIRWLDHVEATVIRESENSPATSPGRITRVRESERSPKR